MKERDLRSRWRRWLGQICSDSRYTMLLESAWSSWLTAAYHDQNVEYPRISLLSDPSAIKSAWLIAINQVDVDMLARLDALWVEERA